jgi:hypothetical protein
MRWSIAWAPRGFGQGQTPRGAVDQRGAQAMLQRIQMSGGHGRRNPQFPSRRRQPAQPHGGGENFEAREAIRHFHFLL